MPKPRIAIVGPGVVGRAVGRLLRQKRFPIGGVCGTTLPTARAAVEFIGAGKAAKSVSAAVRGADVVFVTTSDRSIRAAAEEIAASTLKGGACVFHCSGAYQATVVEPVRRRDAHIAALHPIQSFPTPEAAVERMKGTWFAFEGDEAALPVAEEIVKALGGRLIRMPKGDKALYHAACCMLSNYFVALADLGFNLLQLSGLSQEDATKAGLPLLQGTLDNIATVGLPGALTGPIARGDADTVVKHLNALRAMPRDVRQVYRTLGLYTIRVGQRKGTLQPAQARELARVLTEENHQ